MTNAYDDDDAYDDDICGHPCKDFAYFGECNCTVYGSWRGLSGLPVAPASGEIFPSAGPASEAPDLPRFRLPAEPIQRPGGFTA